MGRQSYPFALKWTKSKAEVNRQYLQCASRDAFVPQLSGEAADMLIYKLI